MSRIGKQPVVIPSGVDVTIDGQNVSVKGPKGTLELAVCSRLDLRLPTDAGALTGIDFSRDRTEELDKAEK